jgi:hypothetical protein
MGPSGRFQDCLRAPFPSMSGRLKFGAQAVSGRSPARQKGQSIVLRKRTRPMISQALPCLTQGSEWGFLWSTVSRVKHVSKQSQHGKTKSPCLARQEGLDPGPCGKLAFDREGTVLRALCSEARPGSWPEPLQGRLIRVDPVAGSTWRVLPGLFSHGVSRERQCRADP